jgi:hypothetical protein
LEKKGLVKERLREEGGLNRFVVAMKHLDFKMPPAVALLNEENLSHVSRIFSLQYSKSLRDEKRCSNREGGVKH